MYLESNDKLYRQDFLKEIEDFINFVICNPKNISNSETRYPCAKWKNKRFNIKMSWQCIYLFVEKYLDWFAHLKQYVPYETMLKMMVGSTFSSSNIYVFATGNINSYRSMEMSAMKMNYDYLSKS